MSIRRAKLGAALVAGVIALGLVALACEEEEGLEVIGTPSGSPAAVEESPAVTEEEVERIVPAAPGAVAEAEGVSVTLNEVLDPWVDPSGFFPAEPPPANRFVAFNVTIENVRRDSHRVSSLNFRLETSTYEGDLTFFGPDPDIFQASPEFTLGRGKKAQGWIGFTLEEDAKLRILKYDPDRFTTKDIEFQFE